MKKLMTLASASVLALAANQASAAVFDVTAVITGGATGAGTSVTTGSATGTYDDVSQILTLNYVQQQDTTEPAYAAGVMELEGIVVADFANGTGTNEVLDCTGISGLGGAACGFAGVGNPPTPVGSLSGTWESFTTVTTAFGATATLNYAVEAVAPEVPVPAAAWLFGSALIGLGGVARRRKA